LKEVAKTGWMNRFAAIEAINCYTKGDSGVILFHIILCQLIFAAMSWVKLFELFVTVVALRHALSLSQ